MTGKGPYQREPHWRQYLGLDNQVTAIEVQDFDYGDYRTDRFLSLTLFESEDAARATPVDVLDLIAQAGNREGAALAWRNIEAAKRDGLV